MKTLSKKTDFKALYNSTIFSNIYKKNSWGGKKGEFYSGTGSHNYSIPGYSKVVSDFILKNEVFEIIEIGCGDFVVSNTMIKALDDAKYDYAYTGYDVVKPLIARNKKLFGSSKVNFICKDSCTGLIKAGDLLIIRQVLQHLNNRSIQQIVNKFKNYKYIIFTEHQASEKYGDLIVPNLDQSTGVSIRLRFKSGVYLEKAPYNCEIDSKLFEISQPIYGLHAFINTFLIITN
jgi:SAM-dependent methyltransferase